MCIVTYISPNTVQNHVEHAAGVNTKKDTEKGEMVEGGAGRTNGSTEVAGVVCVVFERWIK